MPVLYNSKKITPAPQVTIRKEFIKTPDGTTIGTTFVLTINGEIVAHKGSPNSSGTFWTSSGYPPDESLAADSFHTAILRKQEALRDLFSEEGHSFECQPWDGAAPIKCNPRVINVDLPEGQWVQTAPYTIVLEADILYVNGQAQGEDDGDIVNYKVASATNEWNIEPADDIGRSYRLTHSLSAVGKRFYDETGTLVQQAWENARDYVLDKIQLGLVPARMEAPEVLDLTHEAFNRISTQHVNELAGEFSVTETWLTFDPDGGANAIDEYEVNTREDIQSGSLSTVSITGTIRGLDDGTDTRYTNAQTKLASIQSTMFSRAETISGLTLNPVPLAKQIGRNDITGVITYTYEYDNRPTNNISGSLSEIITIENKYPNDVFAIIPILGRAAGPIIQDIGTVTNYETTVTLEAVMPASLISAVNHNPPLKATVDLLMLSTLKPSATARKAQDSDSWSAKTGRFTRRVTWVY